MFFRRKPLFFISLAIVALLVVPSPVFGQDNGIESVIPAYVVWDLTAEVNFYNGRVGLLGGVHNLFNEDHYGEIRDEGIVPAYRRSFHRDVALRF